MIGPGGLNQRTKLGQIKKESGSWKSYEKRNGTSSKIVYEIFKEIVKYFTSE